MRVCSIQGCKERHSARGYCKPHYAQAIANGTIVIKGHQHGRTDPVVRFEEKTIPEPMTGCWLWNACMTDKGYGQFSYLGSRMKAHRASWLMYRGPIPDGMVVCHHCDTPSCVNPDHLFLGTLKDNTRDMLRKGRAAQGEKGGHAKLTNDDVLFIRSQTGVRIVDLAKRFNVSSTAIAHVVHERTWRHLL